VWHDVRDPRAGRGVLSGLVPRRNYGHPLLEYVRFPQSLCSICNTWSRIFVPLKMACSADLSPLRPVLLSVNHRGAARLDHFLTIWPSRAPLHDGHCNVNNGACFFGWRRTPMVRVGMAIGIRPDKSQHSHQNLYEVNRGFLGGLSWLNCRSTTQRLPGWSSWPMTWPMRPFPIGSTRGTRSVSTALMAWSQASEASFCLPCALP